MIVDLLNSSALVLDVKNTSLCSLPSSWFDFNSTFIAASGAFLSDA